MPEPRSARCSFTVTPEAPPPAPAGLALFADLDGTLTPFAPTPSAVGPDGALRAILNDLRNALEGRLAIVSGRSLVDVDRILEGQITPVAAVHGLVRRTASGVVRRAAGEGRLAETLDVLSAFAARQPGLLVEDKGLAAALHYRLAPEAREASRQLARLLADRCGLQIQEGDMVVELRVAGADKGSALAAFMAEPPFSGATPWFIGDDLTDEDGFSAAQALGGYGVIVGARRPTVASFALANPEAVRSWLRAIVRGAA